MDFDNYANIIRSVLSTKRYEHSLRVMETALAMARNSDVDPNKVHLASLLHDYAKDMSHEQLLKLGREHNLITCRAEEVQPDLLHGPVAAWLCQEKLHIRDEEVLQAIHYHTTGHTNMSELDIIVYLADLIEPGRTYQGVKDLQKVCQANRERGLLYAFDLTLEYVLRRNLLIHPLTVEARNWWILKKGGKSWMQKQ